MQQQNDSLVIDRDGRHGFLDVAGTPEQIKRNGQFHVRLENGSGISSPQTKLWRRRLVVIFFRKASMNLVRRNG